MSLWANICPQIGSRWIVTAAHCVFSKDDEVGHFDKFYIIIIINIIIILQKG